MLRRLTVAAVLAVGVSLAAGLATAEPALAKGATRAEITGPGVVGAIVVADAGEPGQSGRLAMLAEQSGLFTALFGADMTGPHMTLRSPPPEATLGPRYTVAYTVPGVVPEPGQEYGQIRQHLYPYASDGPLVYTPHGQHGFGRELQVTGWLRAQPGLVHTLARLGIPPESKAESKAKPGQQATLVQAPSSTGHSTRTHAWPIGAAAALVAGGLAGAAFWRRRRSRPSAV